VTTLRQALAAQLARYDDDAFAALANRGLLRRAIKDLEKTPATVAEERADALVMAFGEHRIRFDARGPAHAQCSCPASGVCQHILAAALTLQRASQADASPPPQDVPADEPDPLAALHDALAAIGDSDLVRHAGKPGYRWAWQFVQDLEPGRGLQVNGERHLVLAFAHPRVGFRYMGGGLDALVTDTALSQPAKYRVAAVLAYRRQRGLAVAPPEPTGRGANASLDLGADHPGADEHDTAASRARLRQAVQQLIAECVVLGLSHLSLGINERFATLAVWAQGAEYPRLSLLLRRAADHVELLLDRAGGADEQRLLDELTLTCGLVRALESAAARGAAPRHLVGRARTRYQGAGPLELIGLGAHAWRTPAGYVGLTMLFWSPADQSFMSCSDARPESLRGFDPVSRYRASGPWSGLGAPQQATGRRMQLTGAQMNHQGRLSAAEATTAIVLPPDSASAIRDRLPAVTRWAELAAAQAEGRDSLLGEAQPMKDWVVLEPASFDPARFDTTRQVLVWPLHDADGNVLHAELAWSPHSRHAIARIEHLPALARGTRVVVRLLPGPSTTGPDAVRVAEPLSLVRVEVASGQCVVDALFFDPPPEDDGSLVTSLAQHVAALADALQKDAPSPATPLRAKPLPRVLRELRQWLQSQAERGIGDGRETAVMATLAERGRRCADAGFTAFDAPSAGAPAAALLRANYLCLQVERLLAGAAVEPA
jgi:hypothetical protein